MDETTNSRDAANEADDRESIAGIEEKSRDKKGNKHKEKYEKKCSSGARAEWEQKKNRRSSTTFIHLAERVPKDMA